MGVFHRNEIAGDANILVVGLGDLLEQGRDLCLARKAPQLRPGTAAHPGFGNETGSPHHVGSAGYAVAIAVVRVGARQDGLDRDGLDHSHPEYRRRHPEGPLHPCRHLFGRNAGNRLVLVLGTSQVHGRVALPAEADKSQLGRPSPIAGMTAFTTDVVEDGAEPFSHGESTLEILVTHDKDGVQVVRHAFQRRLEIVSFRRPIRQDRVAAHGSQQGDYTRAEKGARIVHMYS